MGKTFVHTRTCIVLTEVLSPADASEMNGMVVAPLQVGLEFKEFWESVYAKVDMQIPEGYNRNTASFDLFNGVRFGDLNRVLIDKDPFFAKVKFDASSPGGFNPFIEAPEPTAAPEPTFPPTPLIMVRNDRTVARARSPASTYESMLGRTDALKCACPHRQSNRTRRTRPTSSS